MNRKILSKEAFAWLKILDNAGNVKKRSTNPKMIGYMDNKGRLYRIGII